MMTVEPAHAPWEVDIELGRRIRGRRKLIGVSKKHS